VIRILGQFNSATNDRISYEDPHLAWGEQVETAQRETDPGRIKSDRAGTRTFAPCAVCYFHEALQ
jgi:hypothetical protein